MDQVTTDAGFSHRKPIYSFKNSHSNHNNNENERLTLTPHNGSTDTTPELGLRRGSHEPTRRRTEHTAARRPRHWSAPDLSFGGSVDFKQLEINYRTNQLKDESPLKTVRRTSLGSDLEHIEEGEETISDSEAGEDNSIEDKLSISERLLARPVRLPPIFENQGFKPQKRDFKHKPSNDNSIEVSEAIQHRYVRNRPNNRQRKMSM